MIPTWLIFLTQNPLVSGWTNKQDKLLGRVFASKTRLVFIMYMTFF